MVFKITGEQCHDILRDEPEDVYNEHLQCLYAQLALCDDLKTLHRLQGNISMLQEVLLLKNKATLQLDKN